MLQKWLTWQVAHFQQLLQKLVNQHQSANYNQVGTLKNSLLLFILFLKVFFHTENWVLSQHLDIVKPTLTQIYGKSLFLRHTRHNFITVN